MKTKVIFLFFIVFRIGLMGQQGQAWEEAGLTLYPLKGGEAIQYGSDIYLLGGYSDSLKDNINLIQCFKPYAGANKFNEAGTMLHAGSHLIAGVFNDKIYVCGSLYGSLDTAKWGNGFIESIIPTDTGIISTVIDTNFMYHRAYSTGLIKDSIIYIIGGLSFPNSFTNNAVQPYIVSYNLDKNSITYGLDSLPNSTIMPYNQMSAVIGDTIYIFGGIQHTISKDIYKYVITTHTIEKLNVELKIPRAGGRAVYLPYENRIMIIGGFNESSVALRSTEYFNLTPNGYEVTSGPSLKNGRQEFAAVTYSKTVYVFGGIGQFNNSIYEIEFLGGSMTGVDDENNIPDAFLLRQNYPNPFNPFTTIKFTLPKVETSYMTSLRIYNILGKEIITLINKELSAGEYEVELDGSSLSSGIYFYTLQSGPFTETKKMILLK
ncbi:MAG: T9SS C-terminal target domain-containing protein [Ignavibacteriales bacterium]|nr:MAG: T9SS C-terminal target domain-containing protein [Ignavibacteriales bacterium]